MKKDKYKLFKQYLEQKKNGNNYNIGIKLLSKYKILYEVSNNGEEKSYGLTNEFIYFKDNLIKSTPDIGIRQIHFLICSDLLKAYIGVKKFINIEDNKKMHMVETLTTIFEYYREQSQLEEMR